MRKRWWMALSLAAGLTLFGATGASAAEPQGAEDARAVIQSQLEAFAREDVEAAYQYAAPNIKRMFVEPDIFGDMVRNGYPMVWDQQSREFLEAEPYGGGLLQRLRLVDRAGRPYIAEYQMFQVDGEWRIAGVRILRDDSFGA